MPQRRAAAASGDAARAEALSAALGELQERAAAAEARLLEAEAQAAAARTAAGEAEAALTVFVPATDLEELADKQAQVRRG